MSFSIEESKFGKFNNLEIINSETKEYVSIINFGATVNELVLMKDGKSHSIIDGYDTDSKLIENRFSKSKKLVPFPNRINDGKYSFDGKDYQLPINFPSQKHAIHGFVYDKNFNITKKEVTNERGLIQLEYRYDGGLEGYPFKFLLDISYFLGKEGFKCTTKIKNIDNKDIPIGDGWHPYFKTKGKVDDLMLQIPSQEEIKVDERSIPTGKVDNFTSYSGLSTIGDRKFDTGFAISKGEGKVSTKIYDPTQDLEIILWQETGKEKYNYLQVFIPPSRESIAVEPMTCMTNAFNNKKGLIILKPEETFMASYGVRLG